MNIIHTSSKNLTFLYTCILLMTNREMAESAYRDAVAEAGKGQDGLTDGWKVLGLEKDKATEIFEETKRLAS